MIILIKKNCEKKQYDNLIKWVKTKGVEVHVSEGESTDILGLVGDTSKVDIDLIRSLDIVERVERIQESYKNILASIKTSSDVNALEIRSLENKLNSVKSRLNIAPRNENDFKNIARQQQTVEAMYLFLLQKREEMEIAGSVTPENIKVIEGLLNEN